ncbi:hypothetical protein GCM10027429_19030 [Marivirga atlantica]|jgi:hypothetical protein|uniref:Lipocalin-like domain-containing protein n=1 Tax=Marivirga atlantica TaxID=1548457 RepID=A0A937A8G2_9BACT|nr:hypothetical protein [Marivirga atlantica]MBL0765520.1 hypothetical protein [Marivirga atlantica]
MRNIIPILILFSCILLSCNEEELVNAEAIGTYILTERYSDPGDGSGTFQPVESDRRITLKEDNTYSTNYDFCNFFGTETKVSMNGKFNREEQILVVPDVCSEDFYFDTLQIELKPQELIIYYLCIEGCAEKFRLE